MPIKQERRIYVTFKDEAAAHNIKIRAGLENMSASKFITTRLTVLDRIEANVGSEVVERLSNGRSIDTSASND